MKKKLTINDIALQAGVSKTTVSFYLNGKYNRMSEETRARIARVIGQADYHPSMLARSLSSRQTHLLGVLVGRIDGDVCGQEITGISDQAEACGYQIIVSASSYVLEKEQQKIRAMAGMGADGFIVRPSSYFEAMWQELGLGRPAVLLDSPNPAGDGLWVKANHFEAVYQAMQDLADRGYEEFVMITPELQDRISRIERSRGFEECMKERKLPHRIITVSEEISEEEMRGLLQPYLSRKQRTLLFVSSRRLLARAYLAARGNSERTPDPDALGLIGLDSLAWTGMVSPSVTTIVRPAYEEGRTAARILIDRIEGRNQEAPNWILPCRVNEMESTGRKADQTAVPSSALPIE